MTAEARILDLSTLWKEASIVFPYFDRRELDWDEAYRNYLTKVIAAEDDQAFHLLLAEFMNLLGDGHTDYLLPKELVESTGHLPFSLVYKGGGYCISAIMTGGEEHLCATVLSINGTPFREMLAEAFRYIYHVGDYAYPSRLHQILPFFLRRTGNTLVTSRGEYRFDLQSEKPALIEVPPAEVSIPCEDISAGRLTIRLYEGGVLYIRLDDFLYRGAADEVSNALSRHPGLKGVILDVRENVGGMTMFGAEVAKLFIPGEFHACKKRTRTMTGIDISSASQILGMSREECEKQMALGWYDKDELERCRKINSNAYFEEYRDSFGSPEHEALYSGPCVLLTSRNTISAAEDFVAMFRTNSRATILGAPTCGTTGTPLILRFSSGARARICSVSYELLDGTGFIGHGIEPDELFCPDVSALTDRVDTLLDHAISKLQ